MLDESIESNSSKWQGLDCIVASDINSDMMGYSDTETKIPVVNASGLTAEEIKSMIDRAINK